MFLKRPPGPTYVYETDITDDEMCIFKAKHKEFLTVLTYHGLLFGQYYITETKKLSQRQSYGHCLGRNWQHSVPLVKFTCTNYDWVHRNKFTLPQQVKSLAPSDTLWWCILWSTYVQVMTCNLTASHCLNQCWLIISKDLCHANRSCWCQTVINSHSVMIILDRTNETYIVYHLWSQIIFDTYIS